MGRLVTVIAALLLLGACSARRGAAPSGSTDACPSQALVVREGVAIAVSGQQESVFDAPAQLLGWLQARQRGCQVAPVVLVTDPGSEEKALSFGQALQAGGLVVADLLVATTHSPRVFRTREELGEWAAVVPPEFPFHQQMLVEASLPAGPVIGSCLDQHMTPEDPATLPKPSPTPRCCPRAPVALGTWWLGVELPRSSADRMNQSMSGHERSRCRTWHAFSQPTLLAVPRSALPVVLTKKQ